MLCCVCRCGMCHAEVMWGIKLFDITCVFWWATILPKMCKNVKRQKWALLFACHHYFRGRNGEFNILFPPSSFWCTPMGWAFLCIWQLCSIITFVDLGKNIDGKKWLLRVCLTFSSSFRHYNRLARDLQIHLILWLLHIDVHEYPQVIVEQQISWKLIS